jgi:hypothetical protein
MENTPIFYNSEALHIVLKEELCLVSRGMSSTVNGNSFIRK